jgi:hypothetical protein
MKKSKKEVSDKVVIAMLIVAVVVSVFGAYMVYDYSSSYDNFEGKQSSSESYSVGYVSLNVVGDELNGEGVNGNEGIE